METTIGQNDRRIYVICRKDFSVVAVIELDDSTHTRQDRKKSDEIKDAAFKGVDVEILRLTPGALPAVSSIQTAFQAFLKQSPLSEPS